MKEIDLLSNYPVLKKRYVSKNSRTIKNRITASYRDKNFYDGKRNDGYGGFKYDGRWKVIAKKFFDIYRLKSNAKILQIGSDKGFLLQDIKEIYPKSKVRGIEVSDYAIKHTNKKIKKFIQKGLFYKLPFKKNEFDFVIAIGPVYSLNLADAIKCLKEIDRVGKGKSFITLGAYDHEKDLKLFRYWTLLGSTILSKKEWIEVLKHTKYKGDYKFNTAKSLNLVQK
jgi:ubiquinone/menaquinone biosynthesis C-methylase UbiE